MRQGTVDHPSPQQLSAFGLGRMEPADRENVEQHVAGCDTCCDALRQIRNDTLVDLLQSARPHGALADTCAASRTNIQAPRLGPSEVPAELLEHPKYRIIASIGAGGMGVVYRAEHRVMERTVALKVISPEFLDNPQAVERFRQEVKAAGKLMHPNIVAAHDAEQAGGFHFLVMEFVDGTSLARVVEKRGALPAQYACHYVRQAALGLQHAHAKGMVHRDIKPQNLMLSRKGQVKILDFGLARLAREREEKGAGPTKPQAPGLTSVGTVLGTPDYIAPEQVSDARTADIRSDLYSLGCTLYFLLTGRVPFPGGSSLEKMMQHALERPARLAELRPDLPADLVAVVEKMMAKNPEHRFQKPAEAADALLPFTRSTGISGEQDAPLAVAMLLPDAVEGPPAPLFVADSPRTVRSPARERSRFRAKRTAVLTQRGKQLIAVGGVLLLLSAGAGAFVKYGLPLLEKQRGEPAGPQSKQELPDRPKKPAGNETTARVNAPARSNDATSTAPPVAPPRERPARERTSVLMVIASQGFYYPDYGPVKQKFEKAGFTVTTAASRAGDATPMQADGKEYPTVRADLPLSSARAQDYDVVVFCGGVGVLTEYCDGGPYQGVATALIHEMLKQDKPVTALCGGPAVLADAGVLKGKKAVCYQLIPLYKERLIAGGAIHANQPVVEDGLIITGRGPGKDADDFAWTVAMRLRGR